MAAARSVFDLNDLTHWSEVGTGVSPVARLAVIGDPVAHSKSPQMHNPGLAAAERNASYIRVHVPPGKVREALGLFGSNGFWGVNVTIPHKFEALAAVDFVDPLAVKLGAVNTVAFRANGLHGYNTDGPGFLKAVRESFGREVKDLSVLILGAGGGAGRAVAVQCALEGCPHLYLANRTQAKVDELAVELGRLGVQTPVNVVTWSDDALLGVLPKVDLIVNGSPVGMKEGDPALLPVAGLRGDQLFFDMAYRADGGVTSLGQSAALVSARYTDGAALLLHQGALSYEHWFGEAAPIEAMRAGLSAAIGRPV